MSPSGRAVRSRSFYRPDASWFVVAAFGVRFPQVVTLVLGNLCQMSTELRLKCLFVLDILTSHVRSGSLCESDNGHHWYNAQDGEDMLRSLSSKVVDFYACIGPSKIGVTKDLM